LGLGIHRDYYEAIKWYCSAAEKGLPEAQNTVAYYIATADAGSHDYRKAAEWYTKAAEKGLPIAQVSLGILYRTGRGVPLDYVEAFAWFTVAKANGVKDAASALESLRSVMTPGQLARAKLRANELQSREIRSDSRSESSLQDRCPLLNDMTVQR